MMTSLLEVKINLDNHEIKQKIPVVELMDTLLI